MVPNANLYLTLSDQKVSVPAHSDQQDVFIVQLNGMKAWSIWAPSQIDQLPSGARPSVGKGKKAKPVDVSEYPATMQVLLYNSVHTALNPTRTITEVASQRDSLPTPS